MPDQPMFGQGGMIDPETPIDVFLDKGYILTKHTAEMLFAEPASAIVTEDDEIAEAPPAEANYRPADIEAVACWNCAHFEKTGVGEDNWPLGVCHLWEAKVQGEAVCDRFTVDATMRPANPNESDTEGEGEPEGGEEGMEYAADSEILYEIFCSDPDDIEMAEDTGLVNKAILKTGEWKKTPTKKGLINKPLKIVRDGIASSARDGIINLQELVDNFNKGAYDRVPIPLTDDEKKDHKNLLRLNTGWVKKLWIKDLPEGVSKLMAGLNFTEPDVRGKVMRGTYPDVSSGVFFDVKKSDGRTFGSALNHVVITHRPFMDGLGPFGVEASDEGKPNEIESFVAADSDERASDWDDRLSFGYREKLVKDALADLEFGKHYVVKNLSEDRAIVFSEIAEVSWVAPFSVEGESVTLSPVKDWTEIEQPAIEASDDNEQPVEPAAAPKADRPRLSPLQQARRLREIRARSVNKPKGGGVQMGVKLDEVDFSDSDAARKALEESEQENEELRSSNRLTEQKTRAQTRIDELKALGFSEMPGFLTEYRNIMLSDDGEPAMVLFSYDDKDNETGREQLTATEVADRLISAIPTDEKGKILFSGQALDTGNNEPPPTHEVEASEDGVDTTKSVEERTKETAEAIGQSMPESGKE